MISYSKHIQEKINNNYTWVICMKLIYLEKMVDFGSKVKLKMISTSSTTLFDFLNDLNYINMILWWNGCHVKPVFMKCLFWSLSSSQIFDLETVIE